ncbi:outer membrane beta-barrel protein [Undibacterium sp. Rencai35W]|uniref:outer membrane beta-barrel protein n=1 Tax=Undibacterium sp. Rencai35W TaxID=3413046 RepID=UPI003BF44F6C
MTKKNILAAALMLAGIALSASASAQTYVAATVGQAKVDADCTGVTNCKTSDTTVKLLGGYNYTQNLGVEAGYFSLGKATASVGGIAGEFKATGVDVVGVVKSTPSNGWVGFGKVGIAYIRAESTVNSATIKGTVTKNSTKPVFGLGATYQISNNVNVRAEYERRQVNVVDGVSDATVSNFSVGVEYIF